jgi:hypothetical protein
MRVSPTRNNEAAGTRVISRLSEPEMSSSEFQPGLIDPTWILILDFIDPSSSSLSFVARSLLICFPVVYTSLCRLHRPLSSTPASVVYTGLFLFVVYNVDGEVLLFPSSLSTVLTDR